MIYALETWFTTARHHDSRAGSKQEGDRAVVKIPTREEKLSIQEVAQATGLTAHTLRYYERAGLMRESVARDVSGGRRLYAQYHVDWINFIKRLRSTGMPIRDIRRYTHLAQSGEQSVADRLRLLQQHQRRVEVNLQEIHQHLEAITEKIADYECLATGDQSTSCTLPLEEQAG
jgi:DNA-binding transcriptional MerR regulator